MHFELDVEQLALGWLFAVPAPVAAADSEIFEVGVKTTPWLVWTAERSASDQSQRPAAGGGPGLQLVHWAPICASGQDEGRSGRVAGTPSLSFSSLVLYSAPRMDTFLPRRSPCPSACSETPGFTG